MSSMKAPGYISTLNKISVSNKIDFYKTNTVIIAQKVR